MRAEELERYFRDGIESMSATERRRAIEAVRGVIRAALFDDASAGACEVSCCPRCGSIAIVKKGRGRNGEQRWLCRDCRRTFCARSERVLCTSKLPKSTWMAYAECFALALPLRECAARCGVCLKTAYTMRHRVIECLSAHAPAFTVERGCGCELDETYFPESFKGNHTRGSFTMPRESRHRGKQVHRRGLSKEQVCVMSGVNDAGCAFFEVAGRGSLSREEAMSVLRERVRSGSIVSTDKANAYVETLSELGVAAHNAYDSRDRSRGTINRINSVHSQLDGFMARFRGVSTKHLQAYLSWFRWRRAFASGGEGDAETVARQLSGGLCRTRTAEMFNVQPPLMGYWETKAAA